MRRPVSGPRVKPKMIGKKDRQAITITVSIGGGRAEPPNSSPDQVVQAADKPSTERRRLAETGTTYFAPCSLF